MISLMFYWSNCFLSMMIARIGILSGMKNNIELLVAAAFPLLAITSIRYGVGTDYFSYVEIFHDIEQGHQGRYEWLYYYLNQVVIYFGGNAQCVFAITAIIFFGCVYKRIFTDSPYPLMSIFLLVGSMAYFTYCNAMRQMTGAAICFYAMEYVYKRKIIPFFCCVFLAAGFHMSCWLYLVIYFCNFNYRSILYIAPLIMIIASFAEQLAPYAVMLMENSYYAHYLQGENEGKGFLVFVTYVVSVFSCLLYNRKDNKYRCYFLCQMMMVFFMILYWFFPLSDRCAWNFWLPQVVLIPMCLGTVKSILVKLFLVVGIVGLFFVYSSYSIVVNSTHNVIPYQTIFDK